MSHITKDEAFQSYQFRQINPDPYWNHSSQYIEEEVSIVSIQADQSRLKDLYGPDIEITMFQSYQFRQINPDLLTSETTK